LADDTRPDRAAVCAEDEPHKDVKSANKLKANTIEIVRIRISLDALRSQSGSQLLVDQIRNLPLAK
jgi:hypothetical protein